MTTATPAPMGEPQGERLAEIRNRAEHQKVLDRSLRSVRAKDHVAAVDDRNFLLRLVEGLEGQLATAREAMAVIAEMHEKTLYFPSGNREPGPEMCLACNDVWPCQHIRALGLDGGGSDAA